MRNPFNGELVGIAELLSFLFQVDFSTEEAPSMSVPPVISSRGILLDERTSEQNI
jgi:hypothetical protein